MAVKSLDESAPRFRYVGYRLRPSRSAIALILAWRVRRPRPTRSAGFHAALHVGGNIKTSGTVTAASDVEITDSSKGVILKSPNGTRFRITISNAGVLTATSL